MSRIHDIRRCVLARAATLALSGLSGCGVPVQQDAAAASTPPAVATTDVPDMTAYLGRWAGYQSWCQQSGPSRSLLIAATTFEGDGNTCAIVATTPHGTGHLVTLQCPADGQATTQQVLLSRSGDTLMLVYPDAQTTPQTVVRLVRCPD